MEPGEILIIVFTGVVAVSTVVYAVLTGKLVFETTRMREVQTEPRVSVRAETNRGWIELVIQNKGQGAAEDIEFMFKGDPTYFVTNGCSIPIDELPIIANGLHYLSPNQSFRIRLGILLGETFTRAMQSPWVFDLRYKSITKRSITDTSTVYFSQFENLMIVDMDPLSKIEQHMDNLRKDLSSLANGSQRLQVITQTKGEFRRELDEIRLQRNNISDKSDSNE